VREPEVHFGGESVQHVCWRAPGRDLGHDVSMIVHDEGQGAAPVEIDGIAAIAAHARNGGMPGLRFLFIRARRACCPR